MCHLYLVDSMATQQCQHSNVCCFHLCLRLLLPLHMEILEEATGRPMAKEEPNFMSTKKQENMHIIGLQSDEIC